MENAHKPRRAHTKTRFGCFSCKKRRIRCDQLKPQCHNRCDRGYECEFPIPKRKPKGEVQAQRPILPTTTEDENSQHESTQSANSTVSTSTLAVLPPRPSSPYNLSTVDLQFMHHFIMSATELQTSGGNRMHAIINLSLSHDMVKYSMLAFAASRLGWLTKSEDFHKKAAEYQSSAYRRLRRAVGSFSRETADAVFAATAILLWQATEWRSWSALVQGIRAVIESMRPWVQTSMFSTILLWNIREMDGNHASDPLPEPTDHDTARLDRCISYLKEAAHFMSKATPLHLTLYNLLLNFAQDLRDKPPGPTAAEQFEILFPLRGWIFLMPTAIFDSEIRDVNHLVAFAIYNATVLAIRPFFPAAGCVFFRILHVEPIREIHKYFVYAQMMGKAEENQDVKEIMAEAVRLTGLAAEIAEFE